jgi:hypothetical protein
VAAEPCGGDERGAVELDRGRRRYGAGRSGVGSACARRQGDEQSDRADEAREDGAGGCRMRQERHGGARFPGIRFDRPRA